MGMGIGGTGGFGGVKYRDQLAQAGLGRRGGKEGKMIKMGVVRSCENGGSDTVLHDGRGIWNNTSQKHVLVEYVPATHHFPRILDRNTDWLNPPPRETEGETPRRDNGSSGAKSPDPETEPCSDSAKAIVEL